MRIDASVPIRMPVAPQAPNAGVAGASSGFGDLFSQAVQRVEQAKEESKVSVASFLNGESEDLHKVALAAQRSSLEFDLFLSVRNKVVSAYQEVMRSQI